MFGIKKNTDSDETTPVAIRGVVEPAMINTTIGLGLRIVGNVSYSGYLQIEGEVIGEISATVITVTENGRVTGGLAADEIIIHGQHSGTLHANRVLFGGTSRVEADVFHEKLVMEDGATFEGRPIRKDVANSIGRAEMRTGDPL